MNPSHARHPLADPFHGPGWVYEETSDGYRILAYKGASPRRPLMN